MEAFGRVLRRVRTARGFSQEELAEKAELHRNFISLVERGKTKPALDSIFALADALGVRASDLIAEAEGIAGLAP